MIKLTFFHRSWTNMIPQYAFPFGLTLEKLNKFKEINEFL